MSKRMQIVMAEAEYRLLQQVAEKRGLTLAAWVREVLRRACRREPGADAERKLASVRAAVPHSFSTGDIDEMLKEIESGALAEDLE